MGRHEPLQLRWAQQDQLDLVPGRRTVRGGSLGNPHATNAVVKLGGPDALSPLEVVRLAEQAVGKTVVVQHVHEEALRAQHDPATDSLQQSFAGLMLDYAHGDASDMADTLRALPVQHLKSVHDYLQATA